jgi:hypothetical protein
MGLTAHPPFCLVHNHTISVGRRGALSVDGATRALFAHCQALSRGQGASRASWLEFSRQYSCTCTRQLGARPRADFTLFTAVAVGIRISFRCNCITRVGSVGAGLKSSDRIEQNCKRPGAQGRVVGRTRPQRGTAELSCLVCRAGGASCRATISVGRASSV